MLSLANDAHRIDATQPPPACPPQDQQAQPPAALVRASIHHAAWRKRGGPGRRLPRMERRLYPAWGGVVACLLVARVGQLPRSRHVSLLPGPMVGAGVVLGGVSGVMGLVEGGISAAKVIGNLFRSRQLERALARHDTVMVAGGGATVPDGADEPARPRAPCADLRERGIKLVDPPATQRHARLAGRLARAKGEALAAERPRLWLGLLRDGPVQAGGAVAGIGAAMAWLMQAPTAVLHLFGLAGGGFAALMSAAHVATGWRLLKRAQRASVAAREQDLVLRGNPFAAAVIGEYDRSRLLAALPPQRPGEPEAADLPHDDDIRELSDFYRVALTVGLESMASTRAAHAGDAQHAKTRIAYGAAGLAINVTVLGLAIAGLGTVAVATAGLGLLILGTVFGLAWLTTAVRRGLQGATQESGAHRQSAGASWSLRKAEAEADPGNALDHACKSMVALHATLRSAGAPAAGPAQRIGTGHRWLAAGQILLHLQGTDDPDPTPKANLAARMAEATLRALGAEQALIDDLRAARTVEEIEFAQKLIRHHLAGSFLPPAAVSHRGGKRAAVGADADQAREPLLAAAGAGA